MRGRSGGRCGGGLLPQGCEFFEKGDFLSAQVLRNPHINMHEQIAERTFVAVDGHSEANEPKLLVIRRLFRDIDIDGSPQRPRL